jgi:2-polyprenyl-3-methyl-5-hydroxy-6-metoxy-1,4-benzoquinol methylase
VIRDCPLCGGAADERLRSHDRNRGIGSTRFTYRRCRACGTVFLADPPSDPGRFYPPSYYPIGHEDATSETEAAKLELLERFAAPGRLIEVGPGAGGFAAAAARAGWAVTGIEMDETACRHLRDIGVEAVRSAEPHVALRALPPARAIVLWHVLEHLAEPCALIEAAAAALEPRGVLIVAVPNPKAFGLRILGERWAHLDAPRHRFLIPASTLLERAQRAGLEPVALVGADRAGRDWNVFAWQQLLVRPDSGPRRRRVAFHAGVLTALALAPVERHGLRGSTYTAVLRQHGGP